jgi:hypothetical protein
MGIPRAAEEGLEFMRRNGMSPAGGRRSVCSDVAPGAWPIELSFSQANGAELRLLTEPCLPGEGIVARTVMGVAAVGGVAEVFSAELAQRAQDLVRRLLPDSEKIAHLNWRSSVWLALRTTGERSAVRIYVNVQFSNARDRWRRIERALAACGLEESAAALLAVRRAAGHLLEPIGLCFDVRPSGLAPARVHGVTGKISPFWLLGLLQATGNEAAAGDAADFLDLFGLLERRGACPILVSLGLGRDDVGSVKIDVDLPNLEPNVETRRSARHLAKAEARFGEIAGYHAASGAFNGSDPRYIGITITPARRFLNVYFPGSPVPGEAELPSGEQIFEKARAFVHAQMERSGALLMDARSPLSPRGVPEEWRDVYMTCLLIQERSPVLCLGRKILERARSYVRDSREGWSWRYLPDLPCDLDDTAMAWAALLPQDRRISGEVVERVLAMANTDGGFPTFIGQDGQDQPSHPAVSLNVAFALDQADIRWPCAATDQYLKGWLQQAEFPACEWMGSTLFPIYLFARATQVLERLGDFAKERLGTRVVEMRRADGTWGGELSDSLDTALAILILDRLGYPIPRPEAPDRFLLESQFDDGGWGWSPLYSDGSGTWFGQRAITTAFAVRALDILRRPKEQA